MAEHTVSSPDPAATVTVGDVRRVMDRAYPPHLAESWDKNGLIVGDPDQRVARIALALECDQAVVEEAIAHQADMIVVHHPLLLRGVSSVAADTPKGAIVHALITHGISLFNAHTNADAARPGVNDHLCEILGLRPGRPLAPAPGNTKDAWGVYVPTTAELAAKVAELKDALFTVGAGAIGEYSECSFTSEGTGQFRPGDHAHPVEGESGSLHRAREEKIEFVAPSSLRTRLLATLREHHPYEEPAFTIVSLEDDRALDQAPGIGRVGTLDVPMRLGDFVARVADTLPATEWGVRATGDPDTIVRTVAVCSGSGDSFLDTVRGLDVDAYLTSDLRHHPVDEYLRAGGVPVIDTAHWASEFPWTTQAADLLSRELGVDTVILEHRSDPWTMSAKDSSSPES